MNVVEIRAIKIEAEGWTDEIESFCRCVLDDLGKRNWTVSVLLCDDAYMRNLNSTYRGVDKPTDVLSFPQETEPGSDGVYTAGDIVVSIETMKKNAAEQKTSEKNELKRLLVHGLLHLAGMDHEEDAEEGGMLDLQEHLISKYSGV